MAGDYSTSGMVWNDCKGWYYPNGPFAEYNTAGQPIRNDWKDVLMPSFPKQITPQGWQCPVCSRVNAPTVLTCPCYLASIGVE